jgi:chorismate synthase
MGTEFVITVYGESHGERVGVIIEGLQAGRELDLKKIQAELDKRRPGMSELTSKRNEPDRLEIASGLIEGRTTGGPLNLFVRNTDVNSNCYDDIKNKPRPGHADYTARIKYQSDYNHRGGGFFSGRMTAAFVMAGAVAKQLLEDKGIKIIAHVTQIGNIEISKELSNDEIEEHVYSNDVRCGDPATAEKMKSEILTAREEGDSVGGQIECRILGMPAGVGEPIFDSIESLLSRAVFSIPAVKGIEFGSGFKSARMRGSEHNDPFVIRDGRVETETNNAGGILGGLSTGMPIVFSTAFKPTPSIAQPQRTVGLDSMEECSLVIKGRHDPCIALRAVPVVESIAAIIILDLIMRSSK